MAKTDGTILEVGLNLEEADAVGELLSYIIILICRDCAKRSGMLILAS